MKYIDTSVIVSALDPLDSEHNLARSVIDEHDDNVISELTLVEMTSVIQRRQDSLNKKTILNSSNIIDLYGKILYILQEMELKLLFPNESSIGSPLGNLASPYFRAIELSSDVPMKTLDLLHLGFASEIGDNLNIKLDFLTRDNEFAKYSDKILEVLGIRVLTLNRIHD